MLITPFECTFRTRLFKSIGDIQSCPDLQRKAEPSLNYRIRKVTFGIISMFLGNGRVRFAGGVDRPPARRSTKDAGWLWMTTNSSSN